MIGVTKPEQTIEVKDESICIKTKTGVWSQEEVMKMNEEYELEDNCVKQKVGLITAHWRVSGVGIRVHPWVKM